MSQHTVYLSGSQCEHYKLDVDDASGLDHVLDVTFQKMKFIEAKDYAEPAVPFVTNLCDEKGGVIGKLTMEYDCLFADYLRLSHGSMG